MRTQHPFGQRHLPFKSAPHFLRDFHQNCEIAVSKQENCTLCFVVYLIHLRNPIHFVGLGVLIDAFAVQPATRRIPCLFTKSWRGLRADNGQKSLLKVRPVRQSVGGVVFPFAPYVGYRDVHLEAASEGPMAV
jgi:hypothetical protein